MRTMAVIAAELTCDYRVRRGGPSSGGGYDRMNRSKMEVCGKPVQDGKRQCPRHVKQWEKDMAKVRGQAHLKGQHKGKPQANCEWCQHEAQNKTAEVTLTKQVREATDWDDREVYYTTDDGYKVERVVGASPWAVMGPDMYRTQYRSNLDAAKAVIEEARRGEHSRDAVMG